jgi:16S rRNA (guanine966-N2)-methyltransferase
MRIVAGKHKGKSIYGPAGVEIRPTSDRVREAIFNILAHSDWGQNVPSCIQGARVLDGFCGTGAMGLEALSRGSHFATFIDNNVTSLDLCKRNVTSLGETEASAILSCDCLNPVKPEDPCDLVFLDPPYKNNIIWDALTALSNAGWIAKGAVCILETGNKQSAEPPKNFEFRSQRSYGSTIITFLTYQQN